MQHDEINPAITQLKKHRYSQAIMFLLGVIEAQKKQEEQKAIELKAQKKDMKNKENKQFYKAWVLTLRQNNKRRERKINVFNRSKYNIYQLYSFFKLYIFYRLFV